MAGAKRGGGRGEEKARKRRKGKGASVRSDEQKEVLIAGVPYPLSPIPLLFPPYPLILSTSASQASFPWDVMRQSITAAPSVLMH